MGEVLNVEELDELSNQATIFEEEVENKQKDLLELLRRHEMRFKAFISKGNHRPLGDVLSFLLLRDQRFPYKTA
jgi:hypothetical protein